MPALSGCQLRQHLVLHPPAVRHHELQHHQGVGGGRGVALLLLPHGLTVPLQGQERITHIVPPVAFLDKQILSLSLKK